MTLTLTTAGESHGPALVAILTGLPAGLRLDRDAIDEDLRRFKQVMEAGEVATAEGQPSVRAADASRPR